MKSFSIKCSLCILWFVFFIVGYAMGESKQNDTPCILVGQLLAQYAGFQGQNNTVTSGLSITLKHGHASDDRLQQMTLQADKDGYFFVKDIDSQAIFFPKLITHTSGWTQELRNANGQSLRPGLKVTFTDAFGSGFSSHEPRGGIRVCSIIISIDIDKEGRACWSFSNSIRDTKKIVKQILIKLPEKDALRPRLEAYLNEAPEESLKKEKIKIYGHEGEKEIEIDVFE